VVATGGVVLAAIYMLWAYQQAFHHEPDPANAQTPDITWREAAVVAPLVVLIVFLGVYPKPVLDRITPSVDLLVKHVDQATGKSQPAVSTDVVAPRGAAPGNSAVGVARVTSSATTLAVGAEVRAFFRRLP
jgi:formate hydrogenlyase subunit 3/multisubunit Na+/H+ antiporter MnhD subunit